MNRHNIKVSVILLNKDRVKSRTKAQVTLTFLLKCIYVHLTKANIHLLTIIFGLHEFQKVTACVIGCYHISQQFTTLSFVAGQVTLQNCFFFSSSGARTDTE